MVIILFTFYFLLFNYYISVLRLFLVFIKDYLTTFAVYGDCARSWVLDTCHIAVDGGIDGGVFKDEVGILAEGAVFENETVNIAEKLFACEVTTHETHIPCIPAKVFAINLAIHERHVL